MFFISVKWAFAPIPERLLGKPVQKLFATDKSEILLTAQHTRSKAACYGTSCPGAAV